MDEYSAHQIGLFFGSIAPWRTAYVRSRLHYVAKRVGDELFIVTARIYLDPVATDLETPRFQCADLEAWQCDLDPKIPVENLMASLIQGEGIVLEHGSRLKFVSDPNTPPFVSLPTLFHPEGLNAGNRMAVLTATGPAWTQMLPQPKLDWELRAASQPFDSIQELSASYGLGSIQGDRSIFEIIAKSVIEVLAKSSVVDTNAYVGVWMAKSLDRAKARIGYRVMSNKEISIRGATSGTDLSWIANELADEGTVNLEVPKGAIVQCFASYDGHTHQVQWRVDPNTFQNPRAAVLSLADPQKSFRSFLQPDANGRGSVASDFEDGVAWLVWSLGFSTASFGKNPKTKDAYDIIAVCPRGDFMVIECTVGLLKSESKLSRLVSRAAALRATLDASNMRQTKVLPVIVSALTNEQLKADLGAAEENKVLVLGREGIDELLNEQYRFPEADSLFDRAWQIVQDLARLRQNALSTLPQS